MIVGGADVRGTMAEEDRTDRRPESRQVPAGLVEELASPDRSVIRLDEVARGRRRAADRAYDDGAVVAEIASQLLLLSR